MRRVRNLRIVGLNNNYNPLIFHNYLGSYYPFFQVNKPTEFFHSLKTLLTSSEHKNYEIDEVAVVEMILKTYMLGDRTIIKGVKRLPWLCNVENGVFKYSDIPPHGKIRMSTEEIAERFSDLFERELLLFLEAKPSKVGVLLSGGMDSRILSGFLKKLQETGDYSGDVVGITWGSELSRDVKFAEEICQRYRWDFIRLDIGPADLKKNFFVAAEYGAEFSPYHLHAIPKLYEIDVDAFFAASYGDSVGRAEFSGVHLIKLKPILSRAWDLFSIIKSEVLKEVKQRIKADAYSYRSRMPEEKNIHAFCEVEQELHYMRRKLQACMNIIWSHRPLHQAFTSPALYKFMWSLSPEIRGDGIYGFILKGLPGKVYDIPWARTGIPYGSTFGEPNHALSKHFHKYGKWLREDLGKFIKDNVLAGNLLSLKVFDEKAISNLVENWGKSCVEKNNRLDEIVSWLATLNIFISTFRTFIEIDDSAKKKIKKKSLLRKVRRMRGDFIAQAYVKLYNKWKD